MKKRFPAYAESAFYCRRRQKAAVPKYLEKALLRYYAEHSSNGYGKHELLQPLFFAAGGRSCPAAFV